MKTLLLMLVFCFFLSVREVSACVTMLASGTHNCSVFTFDLEAEESDLSITFVEIHHFSGGRPTIGNDIVADFRLLIDFDSSPGPRTSEIPRSFLEGWIVVDNGEFEDFLEVYEWKSEGDRATGVTNVITLGRQYDILPPDDWDVHFELDEYISTIPEPSIAILGTLGIFGCLRRKR